MFVSQCCYTCLLRHYSVRTQLLVVSISKGRHSTTCPFTFASVIAFTYDLSSTNFTCVFILILLCIGITRAWLCTNNIISTVMSSSVRRVAVPDSRDNNIILLLAFARIFWVGIKKIHLRFVKLPFIAIKNITKDTQWI